MPALVILEFIVLFLKDFVAAVAEMVIQDAEEVQLSFEAAGALVLGIMQCSPTVKLDDVAEEIRVAIEEIFISFLVEEVISSCASQERV